MIAEILRGSAEKAKEAGALIAGGHTIDDDEPKFGLAVLGQVRPDEMGTKAMAKPGDVVILTKPLGVGIITTAAKADAADPAHLAAAVASMKRLNKAAAAALRGLPRHAGPDVTGFGLLGHGWEVAEKSGVGLRLRYADLPFLPGAKGYADDLLFPAMAGKNRADYGEHVTLHVKLEYEQELLTYCPETSGGLLITLSPADAARYLERLEARGERAWVIGEVLAGAPHIEIV
jgi:selenide,water dikinase